MTHETNGRKAMPEIPTREELAEELEIVAGIMERTGERTAYFGGWGAIGAYGRKMQRTAEHQRAWAKRLRGGK